MRHENSSILELDGKEVSEFTPSKPREKWLRKRTHVKIRVGVSSIKAPEFLPYVGAFSYILSVIKQRGKHKISKCIFLLLLQQNVTANHRVNDAVFTEDAQQVLTGRFMYGPLDMVTLAGEKVICLLLSQQHTDSCQ